MKIKNTKIVLDTREGTSITNITEDAKKFVEESGVENGQLLVSTKHTTTGIGINEKEDGLMADIVKYLDKIAPESESYLHDQLHLRDVPEGEPINGHSHIKAFLIGGSKAIPIINGKPAFGRWQSILFFDFDGRRGREILLQVMGE